MILDNQSRPSDWICVGLDMDGVIFDHIPEKVRLARSLGFSIEPHQAPSEIIKNFLPPEELLKVQISLYNTPNVKSPLMRGVTEVLSAFQGRGIPFVLISRRKLPEVAEELLLRHGLWGKYFSKNNAIFVENPEDKNLAAAPFWVTHYLDDEVKVLRALSSVPNKFLFDFLDVFPKHESYTKVKSWEEFKNQIIK